MAKRTIARKTRATKSTSALDHRALTLLGEANEIAKMEGGEDALRRIRYSIAKMLAFNLPGHTDTSTLRDRLAHARDALLDSVEGLADIAPADGFTLESFTRALGALQTAIREADQLRLGLGPLDPSNVPALEEAS